MKTLDKKRASDYRQAFNRAYQWYLDRQQPDGSFGTEHGDTVSYYNTLTILSLEGKWSAAQRFVRWLRQGDTIEGNGLLGLNHDRLRARASYYPAWHIWGAHLCQMFDMSLKAVDALLEYQDKASGGFYLSRQGRDSGDGYLDVGMTTGIAGMACVITGRLDNAVRAGDFLVKQISSQPELPKVLYNYYHAKNESLLTSWSADLKVAPDSDLETMLLTHDTQSEEEQPYACLGPSMVLLCQLYQITRSQTYLGAAMKLFDLCDHAGDQCYVRGCSTKLGWGLALLYQCTDNDRIFDATIRLCDQLCRTQTAEGPWVHTISGFASLDEQPTALSMAVAGDVFFCLHAALTYLT